MRPSGWLFLTQLAICCALAASAVLYVHYMNPLDSGFCGPQSGCEAARRSGFAYFGSQYVTLPLFAMVAFALVLGLSVRRPGGPAGDGLARLWRDPSVTLFAACGLGAALAVGLILYQALLLEEYCWLCLVVDGSAIASAVFAFAAAQARRRHADPAPGVLRAWAWFGIAALLVAAPLGWNAVKPLPPVPKGVLELYVPGKINVVEFADFECPFCRKLHALLGPLLTEYGDSVHFVRLHRPLLMHPNAEHAARAAICADAQGKGEQMANRLFELRLSPESISHLAESLRLDPVTFDRCLASPETTAALERDAARLPDSELRGLPTTYVGARQIVGVPSEAALRDALERGKKQAPPALSGSLYSALLALALGLVGVFGRRGPRAGS